MKITRSAGWAAITMAVVVASSLAVKFALSDADALPIWPPIGVSIGLVLLAPKPVRPVVIAAAVLAEVVTDLDGLSTSSIPFLLADLSILITMPLLVDRIIGPHRRLERTASAMALFAAAIVTSTLAGAIASFGVDEDRLAFLVTFAVGDALGILAITPLFFLRRSDWIADSERFRGRELAATIGGLAVLTIVAFSTTWPFAYLIVPVTMWLAIRFGSLAAAPTAAAVVLYASLLTVMGSGPFADAADEDESLALAQFFSASVLLSTHLAATHARRADNERLRLRAVLEATPDLVTVVDDDQGVIEAWQPPAEPDLDAERVLEHSHSDEDGESEVVVVPGRDGADDRFFEVRAGEVRAGRCVKVARDVTTQRQNSLDLQRSERRWRTMADAAFEGMVEIDEQGIVVFASDRFAELRGLPGHEVRGRYFGDIVDADDWERSKLLRDQIRAGIPVQMEMVVTFGDGPNRWVIVSSMPLLDETSTRRGSVLFFSETTELHVAEAQRRQVEADLAVVEQRERADVARAIHDGPLQQLVAVDIKLGLVARRGETPPEVTEAQHTVQDTIADIRSTLRDLTPDDVAAGHLIDELTSFGRRLLDGSPTSLVVETPDAEPPLGHTALTMFQIGREALINATTHAEAETISIALERDDDWFVLRVSDDGVGVAPGTVPLSADGHFGIRTMLERASDAGGSCHVRAGDDGGTVVEVRIPRHPT